MNEGIDMQRVAVTSLLADTVKVGTRWAGRFGEHNHRPTCDSNESENNICVVPQLLITEKCGPKQ